MLGSRMVCDPLTVRDRLLGAGDLALRNGGVLSSRVTAVLGAAHTA